MSTRTKITCPDCRREIDVDELVHHQLEAIIRKEYNEKMNQEKHDLDRKAAELEREKQSFRLEQIQIEGEVGRSVTKMISDKMIIIEKKLKARFER